VEKEEGGGNGKGREREESGRGSATRGERGTWNRAADWLRPALGKVVVSN